MEEYIPKMVNDPTVGNRCCWGGYCRHQHSEARGQTISPMLSERIGKSVPCPEGPSVALPLAGTELAELYKIRPFAECDKAIAGFQYC